MAQKLPPLGPRPGASQPPAAPVVPHPPVASHPPSLPQPVLPQSPTAPAPSGVAAPRWAAHLPEGQWHQFTSPQGAFHAFTPGGSRQVMAGPASVVGADIAQLRAVHSQMPGTTYRAHPVGVTPVGAFTHPRMVYGPQTPSLGHQATVSGYGQALPAKPPAGRGGLPSHPNPSVSPGKVQGGPDIPALRARLVQHQQALRAFHDEEDRVGRSAMSDEALKKGDQAQLGLYKVKDQLYQHALGHASSPAEEYALHLTHNIGSANPFLMHMVGGATNRRDVLAPADQHLVFQVRDQVAQRSRRQNEIARAQGWHNLDLQQLRAVTDPHMARASRLLSGLDAPSI